MRMFMLGPAVSLKGSPTVSPTTAALCASEPLPPKLPASMYFFALSQAPPAFAMKSARKTPISVAPARKPPSASLPMRKPIAGGSTTADKPGTIISLSAALVAISTHRAVSALAVPSMRPAISRNWRRTSWTMPEAARPRDAVEAVGVVRDEDRGADGHHGQGGGLEADRDARDDIGGRAGLGALGDFFDALARGVPLGEIADGRAREKAREHRPERRLPHLHHAHHDPALDHQHSGRYERRPAQRRLRAHALQKAHR